MIVVQQKVAVTVLDVLKGVFKNAILSLIPDGFSKTLGLRTKREYRNHLV